MNAIKIKTYKLDNKPKYFSRDSYKYFIRISVILFTLKRKDLKAVLTF